MSALRWLEPDPYHIRTDCGRYTVARVNLDAADVYVAWRAGTPAVELASRRVPSNATDDRRIEAIKAMQERCAEDAASRAPPAPEPDQESEVAA